MLPRRFGQSDDGEHTQELTAAETARSAAESSSPEKSGSKHDDEKLSLFWRVFGGTVLSIAALVAINLFNNLYSSITELRGELNREREARAELVKKDEFNSRNTSLYERVRSFEGVKAELEGLRERVTANAAILDGLKKDSGATLDAAKKELGAVADTMKKEAASLELLKERVLTLEALKKDIAGLELLKERLTTATADLKAVRDDVSRIQQEAERNKAGDMERKMARDAQFKQVEETLKEVQKGLQDCREKLARLEGMRPAGGSDRPVPVEAAVPPTRVADSAAAKSWFPIEEPRPRPVAPGESKGSGEGEAGTGKPPSAPTSNPATSKPGPGGESD